MSAGEVRVRETRLEQDASRRAGPGSYASIVLAALLLTLLNVFKPITLDDAGYYQYAVQIAEDPTDPYGFEMFWGEVPEPAFEVLAAPLLPYWWAGALRLCGDRPVLWKLSLFPFALLLAASLHYLLALFAPGLERLLLWLIVLSPAVLPPFNMMLDVPALALSLASLSLFISACRGGRWSRAVVAGILAGLAVQTKQTSITVVAVLLAYGMLFARLRMGLLAAAVAAALFAGWELLMALQYGESHFLHARALRSGSGDFLRGLGLRGWGFTSLLGGVAAAAVPLGLFGLFAPRWLLRGAILLLSLAFALIPLFPAESLPGFYMLPRFEAAPPEQWVFTAIGCGVLLVAVAAFRRLFTTDAPRGQAAGSGFAAFWGRDALAARRLDLFLLGWLLIELSGCYAAGTFLASRHVIRMAVVLFMTCGRAAAARLSGGGERRTVGWVVAWGIGVGLLFFAADLSDALARRDAVQRVEERLVEMGVDRERESVWYVGHWGFRFYAERLGMRPVAPGRSSLEAGDWLVVPEGLSRQHPWIPLGRVTQMALVESQSRWPWSSITSFYAGPIPLRSQPEAQLVVKIYRVEEGFRATSRFVRNREAGSRRQSPR